MSQTFPNLSKYFVDKKGILCIFSSIMKKPVYLDNAATTAVAPEVVSEMLPYFTKIYANPLTRAYSTMGYKAAQALDKAREQVASLIGAQPEEIYFTSGGSEADNWALKGIAWANRHRGNHIIISAIEHKAVLRSAEFLKREGFTVTVIKVDSAGLVNIEEIKRAITDKTTLVSIMHANNEIGTIQPIKEIADVCHSRGVLFHTDIVQSVPHMAVDIKSIDADLAGMAAHKFYGPKGVGALYIKKGIEITPLIHAGGQEGGLRGSTHNMPGIIGIGAAAAVLKQKLADDNKKVNALTDKLKNEILAKIPDAEINGSQDNRIAGNLNFTFKNAPAENILLMLNHEGIIAAGGSACNAESGGMSHVLTALGKKTTSDFGGLRLSVGRFNTEEEIDYVLGTLPGIIEKIRGLSN